MKAEERIKELGIDLPEFSAPKAMYVPVVQTGNLLFVSGQIPSLGDTLHTGRAGGDRTLEEAQEAARVCAINILASLKAYLGDLDKVSRIVKLQAFVSSADGFYEQHLVANAASQLLYDVYGEDGRHARTAVSVNQLPMNSLVEVEAIVEIRE